MNRLKLSSFYLLFAALLFTGCPKENNPPDEPEELDEWTEGQDVFVTGFENDVQGNPTARLWKNGAVQNLTGSVVKSTNSPEIRSEALSVFVSGDDVYVVGYNYFETLIENGNFSWAMLWKNGEIQELSHGTYSDVAVSVFVSGNDVYVLGCEALEPTLTPHRWALKYWKNGEAVIFDEGTNYLDVKSIFVSDGDVYIAGCARNYYNQPTVAKLWKNGKDEILESKTTYACANSVYVSGSDVYVTGAEDNGQGQCFATLWVNGVAQELAAGTLLTSAESVFVSGGDVYVAGYQNWVAKLWVNGIAQNLNEGDYHSMATSVFVAGDDVYVAGYVEATQEVPPGSTLIPTNYPKATLWKNGKKLKLNTGKNNDSKASSVFVK